MRVPVSSDWGTSLTCACHTVLSRLVMLWAQSQGWVEEQSNWSLSLNGVLKERGGCHSRCDLLFGPGLDLTLWRVADKTLWHPIEVSSHPHPTLGLVRGTA